MSEYIVVNITEAQLTSQEALHSHLKKELEFPDYYGANLSALADCLSDITHPTLITICIAEDELEPGMRAYVLRFVQVCAREALANENLSLSIEHPSANG